MDDEKVNQAWKKQNLLGLQAERRWFRSQNSRSHLHHTYRIHADHHANPAEGRVLLLVVSNVAQRRAPAQSKHPSALFDSTGNQHVWIKIQVRQSALAWTERGGSPGSYELRQHSSNFLRTHVAQAADGDGWERSHTHTRQWGRSCSMKVLMQRAIGEATQISDAKMQILPAHTKRNANMRIKLAQRIKFVALSVAPKKKQWSQLYPQLMRSW